MIDVSQPTQDWIFTFGFGHAHPQTGESLANCFIRIRGTRADARREMDRRFGQKWAFDYESEERAGVQKYNLREIDA